jgi:hypothetical protein
MESMLQIGKHIIIIHQYQIFQNLIPPFLGILGRTANGIGIILGIHNGLLKKLKFYKEIEEFKENFDALISKVENLETFSIDDAC